MTKEEIKGLFPRTCTITQELIGAKDIGTKLLKTFVPEELWDDMFWGLSIGNVAGILIKTEIEVEGKMTALYLDNHITKHGNNI
jgi:hypothetical protein